MKSILLAFVFAFGLMLSLPYPSSGSNAPPGQSSFITEHFDIAPAIGLVQEIAFVGQSYQLIPQVIIDRAKGGGIIEHSLNASLDVGYLNKDVVISKVPIYKLNCDFGFLLCLYDQVIINQSTSVKDIQSAGPVTIRADSQRG